MEAHYLVSSGNIGVSPNICMVDFFFLMVAMVHSVFKPLGSELQR